MRFSILTYALGVAATAVTEDAPTPVKRDLATVTQVMAAVGQSISALDQAVVNFNGDVNQLNGASQNLINVLNQGAQAIQNTSPLSTNDAVSLQQTVGSLEQSAQQLVVNLNQRKPQIQQVNLCDTVRQQSEQLTQQSQFLVSALVNKMPQEVQGVASQFVQGFTSIMQQNQVDFAQGQCINSNGQNGGGGFGGFPTTTNFGGGFPTTTSNFGFTTPRTTTGFFGTTPGFPGQTFPTTGAFRPTTTQGFGFTTSRPAVTAAANANGVGSLGGVALMVAALLA